MNTNLKTLISKLNDSCRLAATRAANICVALGQHEVEVEHLLLALLEQERCDFTLIVRQCGVDLDTLSAELHREVSQFKAGSTRTPVFSRHLPLLLEHAWLIASLAAPAQIRSAHLMIALLSEPELSQLALRASAQFGRIPIGEIKHQLEKYTHDSQEEAVADAPLARCAHTPALDLYTTSLTQQARGGKLDPVIGREGEIRQMVDILLRRRQNNPILTGEAGVGKTAVVEGLALRVATGDVPSTLKNVDIRTLDMGLLQAGASVKGEFENRLKSVIDEVKQSPHPIILFIDEAHTMIGAGGTAGQNDAANLLKPALARGELRTIAATTWSEYKQYFEKDAALARRFQVIKVEEPCEEIASAMLRAMAPLMEAHFGVRIRDEAVTEAVRLSHRYISGRQLPDKAVSVLDTACARVVLAQSGTPALMEDAARQMERIAQEIAALQREEGTAMRQRVQQLQAEHAALAEEHTRHTLRWQREQAIVAAIIRLRTDGVDEQEARSMKLELAALQGETPMVPLDVDAASVAAIVSGWTGIPLGKMVKDEISMVLSLQAALQARILGQQHAIAAVAQRVQTARANLDDPNKPKGVFLFVGPSGVGKTETALALAELLYGGERKLITINMSEYQEAHSVSGLKGSPPGYVGYGQGGVLTEAVRRNPYSVVLLDEIEKAHADVTELFFQVLDKGVMDDAEGREIDFRNTIIIATANTGSAAIMQACLNTARPEPEELEQLLRPQLHRHFKPAFLGRMKVVPYYPIADEVLAQIIALKLNRIGQRIREHHHAEFSYEPSLVDAVLARCTEVDSGARNVDHILNGTLLPQLAQAVLERMAQEEKILSIQVGASDKGEFNYVIQ
ncbi:type VI secretion system ATPase TssH [Duganella sp. CY15W]|uniref:type VI secretion system ATPase TssH n=1 Tax=Duganella sp. CY15W TaxID=2692172 RepID=UPI00136F2110|nr:type VI secretion system ATPase TssH [Duganella sp. CY15W]MYM27138.1 type VI secretion system ATPase TssH [Duganella sp. CY15W]